MQYVLHNGPYRARPRQSSFSALLERFANGYSFVLKLVLILCVAFGFYQLVAFLLTLSSNPIIQLLALGAWACGAVPLVYRLWRMDLQATKSSSRMMRMH